MKSTIYTYSGCALLLLLLGCQQAAPTAEKSNALMANDFEASVGWNEAKEGSLTTEKAHSGGWSVQVQPSTPFSYTFVRQLGQLDPKLTRNYQLKGWALRASTGSLGSLVVQVNKSSADTAKVFYGALPLADAVKSFNKWEAVSMPFTLPASATAENVVKIYLWNDKSTAPTYLDDLELTAAQ
ncbi:carbohydrate binding domain-containing protein [Hymenobacter chitinivorans]|uniref:Carbohydrate binding protein n=1 Tax=Hymenobacter chitinivorans DSM 11115 TaxID=1121954 RepID=A0A2M9AS07_9BACT|nr:hypothetical protein [Hymenobacter chitinivorans]PJJ48482.1 hypothetical protein CLV45_4190 [Hymenobacter chitinivorans DSM 11115]